MPTIDLITKPRFRGEDITGQVFNHLTVVGISAKQITDGSFLWECQCVCGNTHYVTRARLRNGGIKSCGCMRHKYSHGLSHTRAATAWRDMMNRCYNPDFLKFDGWGGRGITVDERWHSIENFWDDMGEPPEGLTLERINNELGYSLANCKWDTYRNQLRNRRNNVWVTAFGETAILMDWAEKSGLTFNTIRLRLKRGMLPEDALTLTTRRGIVSRLTKPLNPTTEA